MLPELAKTIKSYSAVFKGENCEIMQWNFSLFL